MRRMCPERCQEIRSPQLRVPQLSRVHVNPLAHKGRPYASRIDESKAAFQGKRPALKRVAFCMGCGAYLGPYDGERRIRRHMNHFPSHEERGALVKYLLEPSDSSELRREHPELATRLRHLLLWTVYKSVHSSSYCLRDAPAGRRHPRRARRCSDILEIPALILGASSAQNTSRIWPSPLGPYLTPGIVLTPASSSSDASRTVCLE